MLYPMIANVAKRYLCIPGSSVSAERVFSTARDIVTAQRSTLKSEHIDQLVFLHKNVCVPHPGTDDEESYEDELPSHPHTTGGCRRTRGRGGNMGGQFT